MHHDQARTGYKKLFDYINFLSASTPELSQKVEEITKAQKATLEKLSHLSPKKAPSAEPKT